MDINGTKMLQANQQGAMSFGTPRENMASRLIQKAHDIGLMSLTSKHRQKQSAKAPARSRRFYKKKHQILINL